MAPSRKVDLAIDLPGMMGDESEIRDALTNLVLNAADAMPEGGQLTLRTCALGADRVQVEATDTGVGMDEATRSRCLELFFTTKGTRGTGLGLAMVYGAVERHGGEIQIESEPGAASCRRQGCSRRRQITVTPDSRCSVDGMGAPDACGK